MRKFYLTDNGNILIKDGQISFFVKPDKEFIRQNYDNSLFERLQEIVFNDEIWNSIQYELPSWSMLQFTTEYNDYSNYAPELSNNGGKYAFKTTNYFFMANIDGRFQFRMVPIETTSADFSYSEDGHFTDNMTTFDCMNTTEKFSKTERGYNQNIMCSLEQISYPISFEDILNQKNTSVYPDGIIETDADTAELFSQLFDMGIEDFNDLKTIKRGRR